MLTPNLHTIEHEIEQFEDDPLEYIRLDLSLPSASGGLGLGAHDVVTRRQAAADVLRALVSSGFEAEATEVTGAWINQGLQQYNSNKNQDDSWKAKDTAVYLLTAVATRGSTTQVCARWERICTMLMTRCSMVSRQPTPWSTSFSFSLSMYSRTSKLLRAQFTHSCK